GTLRGPEFRPRSVRTTLANPCFYLGRARVQSLLEQHHAGREAVDEVLPTDGAQLALGEEARQRHRTGFAADHACVVVRLGKQPRTPTVAGEEQRSGWLALLRRRVLRQH